MMACRSGCLTKDHGTYGECLRAAAPMVTLRATPRNAWDRELALYASAKEQGISPAGTTTAKVRRALDISDARGTAYDASAESGVA